MLFRTRSSRLVLPLAALLTVVAGCFGQFRLTRTVYEFNARVENKFVRSIATWALVIIPVYEVAAIVDFLVLNVIEFWGGGAVAGDKTLEDGTRIQTARLADDVMQVRWTTAAGAMGELEIVKVSEGAGLVRHRGGAVVATVERTESGEVNARPTGGESVPAFLTALR